MFGNSSSQYFTIKSDKSNLLTQVLGVESLDSLSNDKIDAALNHEHEEKEKLKQSKIEQNIEHNKLNKSPSHKPIDKSSPSQHLRDSLREEFRHSIPIFAIDSLNKSQDREN